MRERVARPGVPPVVTRRFAGLDFNGTALEAVEDYLGSLNPIVDEAEAKWGGNH